MPLTPEGEFRETYMLKEIRNGRFSPRRYAMHIGDGNFRKNYVLDINLGHGFCMDLDEEGKIDTIIDNTTIGCSEETARDLPLKNIEIVVMNEDLKEEKDRYEKKFIRRMLLGIMEKKYDKYYAWRY